jgi:hypothetical protein
MHLRGTIVSMASLLLYLLNGFADAMDFRPGDYYGSGGYYSGRLITHYRPDGSIAESMRLPASLGDNLRGLAFGPDGLLYVALQDSFYGGNLVVHAIDGSGTPQATYSMNVNIGSNTDLGKIAFDNNGHFYVGAVSLVRFTIDQPSSGTLVYQPWSSYAFDVEPLPNGNLLVASSYRIEEITPDGTSVRSLDRNRFADIHSIEYDSASNSVFMFHLGYTGHYNELNKLDGSTGDILATTDAHGGDLLLTTDQRLVDGVRFYDLAFNPLYDFAGTGNAFVTQLVPEPAALSVVAAAGLLAQRRGRRTRRACGTPPMR